jgi:hypothetical protein
VFSIANWVMVYLRGKADRYSVILAYPDLQIVKPTYYSDILKD